MDDIGKRSKKPMYRKLLALRKSQIKKHGPGPTKKPGFEEFPPTPTDEKEKEAEMKEKKEPPKKTYPLRKHVKKLEIEGTKYVMEYLFSWDDIFKASRKHFKIQKNPKIDIHMNKTADLREEFSSYCGMRKTIRTWLFYV